MSEPKRYDPVEYYSQGGSGYGQMKEEELGDFVMIEAYNKVQLQLSTALQRIKDVEQERDEAIRYFGVEPSEWIALRNEKNDLTAERDTLQKRCENLKQAVDQTGAHHNLLLADRDRLKAELESEKKLIVGYKLILTDTQTALRNLVEAASLSGEDVRDWDQFHAALAAAKEYL